MLYITFWILVIIVFIFAFSWGHAIGYDRGVKNTTKILGANNNAKQAKKVKEEAN